MKNKNNLAFTQEANLSFPDNIALRLHIDLDTNSQLYYGKVFMKTIVNERLSNLEQFNNSQNIEVFIKKRNGLMFLEGENISYELDTLFDTEVVTKNKKGESRTHVFLDIIKRGSTIGICFEEVVLCKIHEDNFIPIFERRSSFKGWQLSANEIFINRYAEIHQHTEYSEFDGIIMNKDLANKAEYAHAITDHGNMHGTLEFYKEMKSRGKKPIIGCEVYTERIDADFMEYFQSENKSGLVRPINYASDHMVLLAKNNQGLKNLNHLVSEASSTFHSKPHVLLDMLKEHSEGIIATTACIGGTLGQYIIEKNYEMAELFIRTMVSIFGKEDFYLEIQRHFFELEEDVMKQILAYAKKFDLKIVCGTDAHYLNKEDSKIHEIWLCQSTKTTMNAAKRARFSGSGYYVRTTEEMLSLWQDIPEVLDNTLEIAEKCNLEMGFDGNYYLPNFPLNDEDAVYGNENENQKEYFLKLAREGFKSRFKDTPYINNKEYLNRMKFELDTIVGMGFPSYFTIVQDFILWAEDTNVFSHWRNYFPKAVTDRYLPFIHTRNLSEQGKKSLLNLDAIEDIEDLKSLAKEINDDGFNYFVECATKDYKIQIGFGRGSAAGSLVAYCLDIVKINPIPDGLLFERFLNPDRISMPDIDIDIADVYREFVINYMRVKYGIDAVARIITFNTAAARAVVRDICRIALNFPEQLEEEGLITYENGVVTYADAKMESKARGREKTLRVQFANKICKTIPNKPKITLAKALEESVDFKELYMTDKKVKEVIEIAMKLEGVKKNASQHACGVLITQGPIINYMPKVLIKNRDLSAKTKETVKQWTTQYQATECEELGCLKIDFLGLRTLSTITEAVKNINERIHDKKYDEKLPRAIKEYKSKDYSKVVKRMNRVLDEKLSSNMADAETVKMIKEYLAEHKTATDIIDITILQILLGYVFTPWVYIGKQYQEILTLRNKKEIINFDHIPFNDERVYSFIGSGLTDGIFQVESAYMKGLMKDLYQDIDSNPKFDGNVGFTRICDASALGRPGPMAEIPTYIHNMLHPEDISYDVDKMSKYLDETSGIITYQEQMMFMCRELAGFTPGQADMVRKGCAKKIDSILLEYGRYFIYGSSELKIPGCISNGIPESVSINIWDKMKKFGEYAFNKSHSVSYSRTTMSTAWLSYYYENEYMTALLNSFLGFANKIKGYLSVCKIRDIQILEPNINESFENFSRDDEGIRFGLKGIRDVGKASDSIIHERENGKFISIQNMVKRLARNAKFTKKIYEALSYSGSLDTFGFTRKNLIDSEDYVLTYSSTISSYSRYNQSLLFDYIEDESEFSKIEMINDGSEIPKQEKLALENKFAGFYITEHPLDEFKTYLKNQNVIPIAFLAEEELIDNEEDVEDTNVFTNILDEEDEYLVDDKPKSGDIVKIAGIIKGVEIKHTNATGAKFATMEIEDQSGIIKAVIFSKKYEILGSQIVEGKIAVFEGTYSVDDFGVQVHINNLTDIMNTDTNLSVRSVYLLSSKNIDRAREQYIKVKQLAVENKGTVRLLFRQNMNTYNVPNVELNIDVLNKLYEIMDGEKSVTVNHY